MNEINFLTCSMDDVIARSIALHPSLLAERLRDVATIHSKAAREMLGDLERGTAIKMANDCRSAASSVEHLGHFVNATFGQRLQAFSAAARLQCLTLSQAQAIAARDDAQRS